jgi:hypothetical protein
VRLSGTDANAPINATESLKKGTAFDTKYEDRDTANVNASHRREESPAIPSHAELVLLTAGG